MRVIIPVFGASFHGGTRVLFQIADTLVEQGVKVDLICPSNKYSPIYNLDSRVGVRLVDINNLVLYCVYLVLFFLVSCDRIVLLSHWLTGLLHAPAIVFKGQGIYIVQDTEEVFYPKPTIKGKILRSLVFLSYKLNAENIIVTTKYGLRKLEKILKNRAKPTQISLGVDKGVFKPSRDAGIEDKILVFPRKGEFKGDTLLYNTLKSLRVDPVFKHYKIIGISQQMDLRAKFDEVLDQFISIDDDKLLSQHYNSAAFLLHTSRYEGVCLPILEAISCGCPVVCTNSFGPAHYLGALNSQVTSIRDHENLVSNCHQLIDKKLERASISKSVSGFTIDNFLKNVERFICSKL